jgi:hypothetical protein
MQSWLRNNRVLHVLLERISICDYWILEKILPRASSMMIELYNLQAKPRLTLEMTNRIALAVGLSAIAVGVVLYTVVYNSEYDERLGQAAIWQDPSQTRGAWQKAFVVVWSRRRNGYFPAVFDQGMDFVHDWEAPYLNGNQVFEQLTQVQSQFPGMTYRYTDAEVAQYASSYGIQDDQSSRFGWL